jgi:hypothetical protein
MITVIVVLRRDVTLGERCPTVPGMTQIDIDRVKTVSGCSELWELVASYQGYRDGADGHATEVEISILRDDAGRWRVEATDASGRKAVSNTETVFETALTTCHWYDLDN